MRTIKIYSTINGLNQIDSEAKTWGELKQELRDKNISYSGMKAVESSGNTTLELDDAKLPEGSFVIMLSPEKTKSGEMSYNELRATIKSLVDTNDSAKAHFNAGKNYTNKSRAELETLLGEWYKQNGKTTTVTTNEVPVAKYEAKPVVNVSTVEDEEDADDFIVNVEDAIATLVTTNEYDERTEDFKLAFQLLRGEISAKSLTSKPVTVVEEKKKPTLNDEEQEWINKMRNKL